ncbi:MAG: reverse transcriptase domain-containing protein [Candidatus Kerfeldbacteria bacterium]
MKRQLTHRFEDIILVENLLAAWQEFVVGKRTKADVQDFALHLMDNILQLHAELANGTYRHGGYERFNITDPKPRIIHKASVRDRLLHHAVYRMLYPFFDRTFLSDSYSCRDNKGTHKALQRFRAVSRKVSKNNTKTCWVLQCDIKKFFATINHQVLLSILSQYIPDRRILALLRNIVESFSITLGTGLPLGNLTSQLLVNVYMNEFDQLVKHRLRTKWYIRYADDFVFVSDNRDWLAHLVPQIREYLTQKLRLTLHPNKVSIKTLASGVDFLGWVHFPAHCVLRTTTKRGMMRRIQEHATNDTLRSYLGLLKHGSTHKIRERLLNEYWLWRNF